MVSRLLKSLKANVYSVCVGINPYNSPIASFIIKAAPCLATGNVIIIKPSEKSPLGSLALAPVFEEAGFPKGVVQVVTGNGSTGALFASHMQVRKVCLFSALSQVLALTDFFVDLLHR